MPKTEELLYQTDKSIHRRCFIKKLFLKILKYSLENTCVGASFSTWKETPTQVFSYFHIFKNTYVQHLVTSASELTLKIISSLTIATQKANVCSPWAICLEPVLKVERLVNSENYNTFTVICHKCSQ